MVLFELFSALAILFLSLFTFIISVCDWNNKLSDRIYCAIAGVACVFGVYGVLQSLPF
jgi:hypothetical protein